VSKLELKYFSVILAIFMIIMLDIFIVMIFMSCLMKTKIDAAIDKEFIIFY